MHRGVDKDGQSGYEPSRIIVLCAGIHVDCKRAEDRPDAHIQSRLSSLRKNSPCRCSLNGTCFIETEYSKTSVYSRDTENVHRFVYIIIAIAILVSTSDKLSMRFSAFRPTESTRQVNKKEFPCLEMSIGQCITTCVMDWQAISFFRRHNDTRRRTSQRSCELVGNIRRIFSSGLSSGR